MNISKHHPLFIGSAILLSSLFILVPAHYSFAANPPLTNLVARYVAGVGITSNAGSPDLISQWNDQSGGGYNLIQPTSGDRPYNTTDAAGNPVVRFPYDYPTHPTVWMYNAALTLDTNNSSIFVIRRTYHSANEALVSYYVYPTAMLGTFGANLRLSLRSVSAIHPPLNETLTGGTFGGSNFTGYSVDQSGTAATTGGATETGIAVGREDDDPSGSYFSGDIYEILIYNSEVSSGTVNAINAYAESQYGMPASYSKQVVFEGDSNTEGNVIHGALNYPQQAFPSDWKAYNSGTGGATIASKTTSSADTDAYLESGLSKKVLMVMLGTNDINSSGHTAAATFADLDTYIGSRQAAGWEVWVSTILPVAGTGTGPELAREAYNALLVNPSNYTHAPSKIIDYRSDPRIGGTAVLPSYGAGDDLHLNTNGAAVLGEYAYKALNAGVAPVSYAVTGSATGPVGQNVTLTLTATGGKYLGETITPSDNGAGGTFTPSSIVTTLNTTNVTTVSYQRPTAGATSITFTNDGILVNPSAFSFTAIMAPTVTSQAASSIGQTTATGNGTITATGGVNATARGIVYGSSVSYGATTTASGSFSTGAFTGSITGLSCGATYHVNAYATNSVGTSYGADRTFTAAACAVAPAPTVSAPAVNAFGGGGPSNQISNLLSLGFYSQALAVAKQYGLPLGMNGSVTPVTSPVPTLPAVTPAANAGQSFARSLSVGDRGPDVKLLQGFLNEQGFTVSKSGGGSPGHETDYFGAGTKAALMKFQLAHKKETLDPQGLKKATGFLGKDTMKLVEAMFDR